MKSSAENGAPLPGRASPTPPRRTEKPPRTEEELLRREEFLAHADLRLAAQDLGDELLDATGMRERIGAHPWLTTSIGAAAGFLLARPVKAVARRVGIGGFAGVLVSVAGQVVKQLRRQPSSDLIGALADPRVRRLLFR